MNTISLRSFIAAAEEGSFSKAASRLGITQPAVSVSIANLEKELGVKLFDRSAGHFSLTDNGTLLLARARETIAAEEKLYAAAAQVRGDVAGRLAMAASNIPGEYILPRLIRDFSSVYPRVEVNLAISDSARVTEQVREGLMEVGLTGSSPKGSGLEAVSICPDRLVLIASPGHSLAGKKLADASLLQKEDFVLRESGSGTRSLMLEALKRAGVNPSRLHVVTELGSTGAVMEALEAGMGLSMVSAWAALPRLAGGRLAAISCQGLEARRDFLLISRRKSGLSTAARAFIEHAAANEWPRARAGEVFKAAEL
jgi:DNA-binding transcriptional LysR family regulator